MSFFHHSKDLRQLVVYELVICFYMQSTTYCSECNMTLTEFGRMCERAALHTFMEEMKSTFPAPDGVPFEKCNWLNNLLQQQKLQGMCPQLAVARFQPCDYVCE